jgi:hypothetical protein
MYGLSYIIPNFYQEKLHNFRFPVDTQLALIGTTAAEYHKGAMFVRQAVSNHKTQAGDKLQRRAVHAPFHKKSVNWISCF